MEADDQLEKVAELFKALGTVSRLQILTALSTGNKSVSSLVLVTGLSQPLISQHLRLLRTMNLVSVSRTGREAVYGLTDDHVAHVIKDALAHTGEQITPQDLPQLNPHNEPEEREGQPS